MSRALVIVGCGGFGREVFTILQALRTHGSDWLVAGFVDDGPTDDDIARVNRLRSRVLGPVNWLADGRSAHGVIGVGSPRARAAINDHLCAADVTWATLVHPHSTVGIGVEMDGGTIVAAGARLSTNIVLGRHVHVDQNATVGHDAEIGDFSRLNPNACISGSAVIGSRVLIGANATVLRGIVIADDAVVGAGAVVARDVAAGATVKGVPAR